MCITIGSMLAKMPIKNKQKVQLKAMDMHNNSVTYEYLVARPYKMCFVFKRDFFTYVYGVFYVL